MDRIVAPFGDTVVTLTAGQSIALFSLAQADIFQRLGFPNEPARFSKVATTTAGVPVVLGPYASGATLTIVPQAGERVFYNVGTAPVAQYAQNFQVQQAPVAYTTTATVAAGDIIAGIITVTHAAGATQTYTLPTGTLLDLAAQFNVNDSFDWTLICLSAATTDTATIAAGTGHTIVGNPIVQSSNASSGGIWGNSGRFRTRKTAANTFVTYRIA
jgi:hypothetical protein